MSRDGAGNYSLPQPPFVAGTTIVSADVNSNFSDMASALTQSFSRDGQATATGNWNMGNFRIGTIGAAISNSDVPRFDQVPTQAAPNILVNGDFANWQASTSLAIPASTTATASIYAADQWCMETSASQACIVTRQTVGLSQTRYRARVQRNAGQTGTSILRFQQPLEVWDCFRMRLQRMTVSFRAAAGATFSGSLSVKLLTGTGTEGRRTNATPYTSEVERINSPVAVTTSLAAFSATAPSIVGNIVTQASLLFEWTPAGTAGVDDWFEVQDVFLQFGQTATPFPRENAQVSLAKCQRFFAITRSHFRGRNESGTTPAFTVPMYFPVPLRGAPTVTAGTVVSTAGVSARSPSNITASGCSVDLTATAGPVNLTDVTDWSVDARL